MVNLALFDFAAELVQFYTKLKLTIKFMACKPDLTSNVVDLKQVKCNARNATVLALAVEEWFCPELA